MIVRMLKLYLISIMLAQVLASGVANACSRFVETYPCSNAVKTCVGGSGTRTIEGFQVSRDCWEWVMSKPATTQVRMIVVCMSIVTQSVILAVCCRTHLALASICSVNSLASLGM